MARGRGAGTGKVVPDREILAGLRGVGNLGGGDYSTGHGRNLRDPYAVDVQQSFYSVWGGGIGGRGAWLERYLCGWVLLWDLGDSCRLLLLLLGTMGNVEVEEVREEFISSRYHG